MKIHEKENLLFSKWAKERTGFVADGVIDEDEYLNSRVKIMFVLKEVNDSGGGNWDLREFVREGARQQTWDLITRWVYGIRNLDKEINWSSIENITIGQRKDVLKSICAINLKKSPGGHTTNAEDFYKVALNDKQYINEQVKLYDPDLIICCGTGELFSDLVFEKLQNWRVTSRGIWYHEFSTNKFLIAYSHPEARVQKCLLYYGLIDALKEILTISLGIDIYKVATD